MLPSDHQQLGQAGTKQSRSPAHCSLVTEAGSVLLISWVVIYGWHLHKSNS